MASGKSNDFFLNALTSFKLLHGCHIETQIEIVKTRNYSFLNSRAAYGCKPDTSYEHPWLILISFLHYQISKNY